MVISSKKVRCVRERIELHARTHRSWRVRLTNSPHNSLLAFSSRSRSGQAAMEFLMTYGWAILVVLAAIAALAYFGVLSPEKFLPEKCILQPGIACVSHKVEPAKVTLVISNGLGRTIIINSIDVGGCSSTFSQAMLSGTDNTFVIGGSCNNGAAKEKFKADITMGYTEKDTNLTKTSFGNINTKIE